MLFKTKNVLFYVNICYKIAEEEKTCKEGKYTFWENLNVAVEDSKVILIIFVIGDFNGKVGRKDDTQRSHTKTVRNNCSKDIYLCDLNDLIIAIPYY